MEKVDELRKRLGLTWEYINENLVFSKDLQELERVLSEVAKGIPGLMENEVENDKGVDCETGAQVHSTL